MTTRLTKNWEFSGSYPLTSYIFRIAVWTCLLNGHVVHFYEPSQLFSIHKREGEARLECAPLIRVMSASRKVERRFCSDRLIFSMQLDRDSSRRCVQLTLVLWCIRSSVRVLRVSCPQGRRTRGGWGGSSRPTFPVFFFLIFCRFSQAKKKKQKDIMIHLLTACFFFFNKGFMIAFDVLCRSAVARPWPSGSPPGRVNPRF